MIKREGVSVGRPRFIELGSGLRVEYLKTRCLLRFSSGSDGVELGLQQFCDHLGIDRHEFGPPAAYLLFAGRQEWAEGGTGDMIGSWASETAAREDFRRCREERSFQWAELIAVRVGGDCQRICWFGLDRAGHSGEVDITADRSVAERVRKGAGRLWRGFRPPMAEELVG